MPGPETPFYSEAERPREACAVVGVMSFSGRDVAPDVRLSLHAQQNRGEDGSGIATYDSYSGTFLVGKKAGLIVDVFPEGKLKELGLESTLAIGHNRYATSGSKGSQIDNKADCLQPYVINYKGRTLVLAHNGNIPLEHLEVLRDELPEGIPFQSDTDSEVVAWRIMFAKGDSWREKIANGLSGVVGAYSLVMATDEGDLFGVKDPRGIRPLVFARTNDGVAITSETAGLEHMKGVHDRREVGNGEMVHIDSDGNVKIDQIFPKVNTARCVIEPIYFKQPFSYEGKYEVRTIRERMGEMLAREFQVPDDATLMGIPESGLEIAKGYVNALGRSTTNLIKKNRYRPTGKERTFISDDEKQRDEALELKFIVSDDVADRKLYIIDDSVIRGKTTKRLISKLRDKGALEVHVLSGSPPFVNVCDLGVDLPSLKDLQAIDLIGNRLRIKSDKEIASEIGADSIHYLSLRGLTEAIGGGQDEFCTGCLNGANPIEHAGDLYHHIYDARLTEDLRVPLLT